jgi:hypothetical protein
MEAVARLASPTGQWPEAIHPLTKGGCMGDGQHGWAAAEWVMMLRNCFVREEHDRLIIGSGLFAEWFDLDEELFFGPTLTPWGRLSVRVTHPASQPTLSLEARWFGAPPQIDVEIPGFHRHDRIDGSRELALERADAACSASQTSDFGKGVTL